MSLEIGYNEQKHDSEHHSHDEGGECSSRSDEEDECTDTWIDNRSQDYQTSTDTIINNKSSKKIYKAVAKEWGITCKMSEQCRCFDCQGNYFDCEFDEVMC